MYAFTLKRDSRGMLVFRFDDPETAVKVLKKNSINVVPSDDLFEILDKE